MPASTTLLTVEASTPPLGVELTEQDSDQSPGNRFPANKKTRLYARNSSGSPITVVFEADKYGAEVILLSRVMASGEERIFGPFDPEFLEHSTTEESSNGHVFVRHTSGPDGTIKFVPFQE